MQTSSLAEDDRASNSTIVAVAPMDRSGEETRGRGGKDGNDLHDDASEKWYCAQVAGRKMNLNERSMDLNFVSKVSEGVFTIIMKLLVTSRERTRVATILARVEHVRRSAASTSLQ